MQNPPIINEQPPIPETFPLNSSRSNAYEQYLEELNKYQEQLQQYEQIFWFTFLYSI